LDPPLSFKIAILAYPTTLSVEKEPAPQQNVLLYEPIHEKIQIAAGFLIF